MKKECKFCQIEFIARRETQKYCCTTCSNKQYTQKYKKIVPQGTVNVPNGTMGAISELIVCADLLKKGYEVFRSVSQSCSCDLAVLKGNDLLRIEVTTGVYAPSGRVLHPKKRKNISSKFDVLAICVPDKVIYEPPLANSDSIPRKSDAM